MMWSDLSQKSRVSRDEIQAIRSSTSVTYIYYCQSAFASKGSWRSESQCQSARPTRFDGLIHHDFAVVRLTATNSEGERLELFISAEKERRGQGGGNPGIYINLLTDCALRNLQANILIAWDGFWIQVPLDVLTTKLFEGHDTEYNLVMNNCWRYARAASRSVLLLLSQQPGVNPVQKQILLEKAEEVSRFVITTAIWEAVRGIAAIVNYIYIWTHSVTTTATLEAVRRIAGIVDYGRMIWTRSVLTTATLEFFIVIAVPVGITLLILTRDKIRAWLNTRRSRPDASKAKESQYGA